MTDKSPREYTTLPVVGDLRFVGKAKFANYLGPLLTFVNAITVILFVVKLGNALCTNFIYTYDLPVNTPGTLLSTRFSVYYWFLVVPLSLEMIMVMLAAVHTAIPWDRMYGTLHTIVSIVVVVFEFATLIMVLVVGQTSNQVGDPLNPANSPFLCAANSHPNNPALTLQGCPMPTAPYSITVVGTDLGWNDIYKNNLGFTCAMLALAITHCIISLMFTTRFGLIFANVTVWSDAENMVWLLPPDNNTKEPLPYQDNSRTTSTLEQSPEKSQPSMLEPIYNSQIGGNATGTPQKRSEPNNKSRGTNTSSVKRQLMGLGPTIKSNKQ